MEFQELLQPAGRGVSILDLLVVSAVVVLAVGYLYLRLWRRRKSGACGHCASRGGCRTLLGNPLNCGTRVDPAGSTNGSTGPAGATGSPGKTPADTRRPDS